MIGNRIGKKKFSPAFRLQTLCEVMGRLGEVRSLLPEHVEIMALTTTATKMVQTYVANTCSMKKPIVIALSPCKANLIYNIGSLTSIKQTFEPLLNHLKTSRDKTPGLITYCQSFKMCTDRYTWPGEALEPLRQLPDQSFRP